MCNLTTINIDDRQIKVADIKGKYMSNIVDAAKKCDLIDRIVLFGSSIESRCKETSDIDLAVFGSQIPSKVLTSKKYERFAHQLYSFDDHAQGYDILYFKNGTKKETHIMQNIEKGEVLYER